MRRSNRCVIEKPATESPMRASQPCGPTETIKVIQKVFDSITLCIYSKHMDITYDTAKNNRNITERGLSFDRAVDFDFATALTAIDDRNAYGEVRYVSHGLLDGRLHVLCFVETETGIRVISFRKANSREVNRYENR